MLALATVTALTMLTLALTAPAMADQPAQSDMTVDSGSTHDNQMTHVRHAPDRESMHDGMMTHHSDETMGNHGDHTGMMQGLMQHQDMMPHEECPVMQETSTDRSPNAQ